MLLATGAFGSLNESLQKEVYKQFYTFLYGGIYYITRDHAAAEDIIQETFLKTLKSRPDGGDEVRLKAWIKVVARNESYNYLRKHKKIHNQVDIESVLHIESYLASASEDSVEKQVEAKDLAATISGYLDQMKPEYKMLIEMRWKREMSYKEIAEELDITEEGVKQKLHRAREAIRRKLNSDRERDHDGKEGRR